MNSAPGPTPDAGRMRSIVGRRERSAGYGSEPLARVRTPRSHVQRARNRHRQAGGGG
jgi:hypothetical protein